MQEAGQSSERLSIEYFDGVNSSVQPSIAKKTELYHAENVRSTQIGSIEKREGQTPYGTGLSGERFISDENYALFKFSSKKDSQVGVFRISSSNEPTVDLSVFIYDKISVSEPVLSGSFSSPNYSIDESADTFQVSVYDDVSVSDPGFNNLIKEDITFYLENANGSGSIYYLDRSLQWNIVSDIDGQNIPGGVFDTTIANGKLILVNGSSLNRYIDSDGSTIKTSNDAGILFNSPQAKKVCYYKNRIYLANFKRNGVEYPTTVLRSSYPLGIIALVEGDHNSGSTDIQVTDTKYFYSDSGMNQYEVWRGGQFIETITVTSVNESSVTVNATTNNLLSSDEIWIAGTYRGEKQFRWINNPTSTGRDVKQYDTFRLSGIDDSGITLLETVGNVLMIANKDSFSVWDDYILNAMDLGIGCVSPNGYTKLLGTLYFIDYSGIYSTTGGVPSLISRKVDRYIKGATRNGLENSAAGVKGLSVFFTIGDVTLYKDDGSFEKTLNDVCLEYSIADQNWYVHTNVPLKQFVNWMSEDGVEHCLALNTRGTKQVVDFLSGLTDDGDEIFFRADSQELQFLREFEVSSTPLSIITESRRGSSIRCFVAIDDGDFYEIKGHVKKGVTVLKITSKNDHEMMPVLAKKIRVSFRDSSKQRCRLTKYAILFTPTTIDEPSD